jgi:hypothetical protein
MRKSPSNRKRQDLLAGVLLAALVFRAYVPVGFMPASGTPFLVELCPAASLMLMPAQHHHHSDSQVHFDHCPFGSAPAAGPIAHFVVFATAAQIASPAIVAFEPPRFGLRTQRAHQPRGPPALA